MIGLFQTDRCEAPFVERAQHLRLRLQAHVADFVEEERAAVGLLELSVFVGGCAREGSAPMSKQFALDHVFGNGRAIHFHEHCVFAQTLSVNGACDEFLAGAAFAEDENAAHWWEPSGQAVGAKP